tara:strand:- start:271 stop:474 length:204 start_codon:yes stop_codon:yes gene_type:complete
MEKIVRIYLLSNISAIELFSLIKIGLTHTKTDSGTMKGIMFGIWRFETQIVFGFSKKSTIAEEIGYA